MLTLPSESGPGGGATSSTSLLSLPDELLRAIFRLDYAEAESRIDSRIFPQNPLPHYLINKRLLSICRPLLHTRIAIHQRSQDRALASLVESEERRSNLRKVLFDTRHTLPRLTFAILSQLQQLTSFTVTGDSVLSYPIALTQTLVKLPNLRHLKLASRGPISFADKTFRFSHLRALQCLEVYSRTVIKDTLLYGTYRPIHLKMWLAQTEEPDYPSIPWSSIKSLLVSPDDAAAILDLGATSSFWKSLVDALKAVRETLYINLVSRSLIICPYLAPRIECRSVHSCPRVTLSWYHYWQTGGFALATLPRGPRIVASQIPQFAELPACQPPRHSVTFRVRDDLNADVTPNAKG